MSSLAIRLGILTDRRIDHYTRMGWYGRERQLALAEEEKKPEKKKNPLAEALKLLK